GILSQIQKNTDKIPDLVAFVQRHEADIAEMRPHVADYVRNRQRAVGIGAFIAIVFAAIGKFTGGH
ncbi:MAG: hypothetical protein KGQ70_08970, partial [Alphaproteobacteria bacterium]|nr:hypothetical protein [Alphaproteobacteria bacterium]